MTIKERKAEAFDWLMTETERQNGNVKRLPFMSCLSGVWYMEIDGKMPERFNSPLEAIEILMKKNKRKK